MKASEIGRIAAVLALIFWSLSIIGSKVAWLKISSGSSNDTWYFIDNNNNISDINNTTNVYDSSFSTSIYISLYNGIETCQYFDHGIQPNSQIERTKDITLCATLNYDTSYLLPKEIWSLYKHQCRAIGLGSLILMCIGLFCFLIVNFIYLFGSIFIRYIKQQYNISNNMFFTCILNKYLLLLLSLSPSFFLFTSIGIYYVQCINGNNTNMDFSGNGSRKAYVGFYLGILSSIMFFIWWSCWLYNLLWLGKRPGGRSRNNTDQTNVYSSQIHLKKFTPEPSMTNESKNVFYHDEMEKLNSRQSSMHDKKLSMDNIIECSEIDNDDDHDDDEKIDDKDNNNNNNINNVININNSMNAVKNEPIINNNNVSNNNNINNNNNNESKDGPSAPAELWV